MSQDKDVHRLQQELAALRAENSQLRERLQSQRSNIEQFLDQAPMAISIVRKFSLTYVNHKWLELFGHKTADTVLGSSSLQFLAPDIREQAIKRLEAYRKQQERVLQLETRGLRADGSEFDILLTVTRMSIFESFGYVSFIQDISEQKRILRELARSVARYKAIFNNASAGIAIVDNTNRYLEVNKHYATLFGYSFQEFPTLDPLDLIHPDSRRNTQGLLQQVFSGQIPYYMNEKRFLRADGSTFWGSVFVSPLQESAPSESSTARNRAICLVIDISERKEAEHALANLNRELEALVHSRTEDLERKARALEEANATLQRLDEMKTSFISAVSHELRTPLTSIFGYAKLIHKSFKRNYSSLSEHNHALQRIEQRILSNLEIIEHEGERLTRLVNDILDLHKIEAGFLNYDMQQVSLSTCIYDALLAVGGQFSHKEQVKLRSDVPPNLPLVEVDPDRLIQVLINLLHNAAKFTTYGEVVISAEVTNQATVRVSVSDTGCGIAEDEIHRVFEKFHQSTLGDTLESSRRGTGLGLSICKQIVEHFGGRIWATSSPGQGSTFTFELPSQHQSQSSS